MGPSWPLRGGIARTTTALAAALEARGELAAFLVPRRQYPRILYPGAGDVDVAACPRLSVAEPCFGLLEPWSWGVARRRVAASDGDVLVIPYWTWVWAPFVLTLLRRSPVPALAVVHNPADHDAGRPAQLAARWVLGRCAGFLCHARSVAATLETSFPAIPRRVHPLPPPPVVQGDRQAARLRLGVREDAVALLCFGLIRPYKGVDVLLDAVAQLPATTPIVLLLAGEPWGEAGQAVRRRLADPALRGRVVAHLAWVPEHEAKDWFSAADVAVLPYRTATGSAVAAQALAYGLPVVGSRVGGIAEVVEDGVSGLLVPAGDATALAGALERLGDAEVRRRLSAGARASAGRWSWGSYVAALEELAAAGSAGGGAATVRSGAGRGAGSTRRRGR